MATIPVVAMWHALAGVISRGCASRSALRNRRQAARRSLRRRINHDSAVLQSDVGAREHEQRTERREADGVHAGDGAAADLVHDEPGGAHQRRWAREAELELQAIVKSAPR